MKKVIVLGLIMIMCSVLMAISLPADVNRDGVVNLNDHAIMAEEWLQTGTDTPAEFRPICKVGIYTGNGTAEGQNVNLGMTVCHVVIHSRSTNHTAVEGMRQSVWPSSNEIWWKQEDGNVFTDCVMTSNGFLVRGVDTPVNQSGVIYEYFAVGY